MAVSILGACVQEGDSSDRGLKERVEAALVSASDVPGSQIEVEVRNGTVRLTGSAVCPECGGMGANTNAGVGMVAQSIGAVVRAVPGVERVEMSLEPWNVD